MTYWEPMRENRCEPILEVKRTNPKVMNSIKKVNALLVILLCMSEVQAQSPNWAVNPENYQYSMSIVSFLSVDNKILEGAQDKVAAFVGGEIRGIASPIYVSSADRYLAYLTVFANTENEKIEFKIYSDADSKVVDAGVTLDFKIDAQHGNVFQAFSIANPALRNEAVVTNFYFTGIDSVSTIITDDQINIVLEYDQDLHNLTPEFTVSDGAKMYINRALQLSGTITSDFLEPVSYSVLSEDESVLRTYLVTVSNRQTSDTDFSSTNVITANNDGSNDYWIVTDVFKYRDAEFRILDANGRILFESVGYNNDWNGSYKGSRVERGKYYFVIKDPVTNTIIRGDILVIY